MNQNLLSNINEYLWEGTNTECRAISWFEKLRTVNRKEEVLQGVEVRRLA